MERKVMKCSRTTMFSWLAAVVGFATGLMPLVIEHRVQATVTFYRKPGNLIPALASVYAKDYHRYSGKEPTTAEFAPWAAKRFAADVNNMAGEYGEWRWRPLFPRNGARPSGHR